MNKIILSRKEFEKIEKVFNQYENLDRVVITQSSSSGIGLTTKLIFTPKEIVLDITDVASW